MHFTPHEWLVRRLFLSIVHACLPANYTHLVLYRLSLTIYLSCCFSHPDDSRLIGRHRNRIGISKQQPSFSHVPTELDMKISRERERERERERAYRQSQQDLAIASWLLLPISMQILMFRARRGPREEGGREDWRGRGKINSRHARINMQMRWDGWGGGGGWQERRNNNGKPEVRGALPPERDSK